MKKHILLFAVAGVIFASCSTTIERNANAFGGGWKMTETADKNLTQPVNNSVEKTKTFVTNDFTPTKSERTPKNAISDRDIHSIHHIANIASTENLKLQMGTIPEIKDYNFIQKNALNKVHKAIENQNARNKIHAKATSILSGLSDKNQVSSLSKPLTKNTFKSYFDEMNQGLDSNEKLIAILLGLLFLVGVAGLHRFYLGALTHNTNHYIIGVIQLITFGGCGIWAIIDIIRIIAGDLGSEPRVNLNKEL